MPNAKPYVKREHDADLKLKQKSNHPLGRKTENQIIAEQRVAELFKQAENMFEKNKSLSIRYITLARKITLKYKISLTRDQKLRYCKNCLTYLKLGKNSRIRVINGKIILNCLDCGNIRRFGYKNAKKPLKNLKK